MSALWLIKSEPDRFSFADLQRVEREPWNGIRNYQARNFLRQMRPGDLALFYHSRCQPPGVVGVARVVSGPQPDNLQFDLASPYVDVRSDPLNPRWSMVEIAAVAELPRFVTLQQLRDTPQLSGLALLQRGSRLSVTPLRPSEFAAVLALGSLEPGSLGLAPEL